MKALGAVGFPHAKFGGAAQEAVWLFSLGLPFRLGGLWGTNRCEVPGIE